MEVSTVCCGHLILCINIPLTQLATLLRPGPYICAEWEWGGHPYWLLHDPTMNVRTTYPGNGLHIV